MYDVRYNNQPLKNLWVNPIYYTSNVKVSSHMDANIWGLEAGFDIQEDANNKFGAFISYRKGNYDLNGRGNNYYSTIKSEIDINSYLAGLYYRYDKNRFWFFSTIYGGVQQADIKTKDGMKAESDGTQFAASFDLGYLFPLKNRYTLEPNIGVSYMMLDFDKIHDQTGLTANYDTLGYGEAKLALKLEKTYFLEDGPAKIYVKPSIIRTFVKDDNVSITALGKLETYDNITLGRIEVGGRIALENGFSSYGSANYTYGSDYSAASFTVGLNYAW